MMRALKERHLLMWEMSLFFLLYSNIIFSHSFMNLEENLSDFVLETKRIHIPNYPHAFNAAIVKWHDALLMSFRIIPNPKDSFQSRIGLVWLNENFEPIGEPQILNLRKLSSIPHRTEDARLICLGDRLFMVYQDNTETKISKKGFRMYVAELCYNETTFSVKNPICLSPFEGESPSIREKNWVPFIYEDQLFLAYSLNPHRIFLPRLDTGECQTAFNTSSLIQWNWGILRGGTPGLIVNDQYLAFFHSSINMITCHSAGKNIDHYFIGTYTFSAQPPFEITQMSPKPIIGQNFYQGESYKPYWKPIQAVFPCGFIFDDQNIWLSYGRQDHEIWVIKMDKQGLLRSLVPLENAQDQKTSIAWPN
jgi:predicted GH43/DUF377 family glycosyl hydrolase